MADTNTCAHPACKCLVAKDGPHGKYCSEHCKDATEMTELRCQCEHPACTRTSQGTINGSAISFHMSVPIGGFSGMMSSCSMSVDGQTDDVLLNALAPHAFTSTSAGCAVWDSPPVVCRPMID